MPRNAMRVFSRQLSALRIAEGLSQEEIAHRAGIAVPTYRRLETFPRDGVSPSNPCLGTIMRALRACGLEDEVVTALAEILSSHLDGNPVPEETAIPPSEG